MTVNGIFSKWIIRILIDMDATLTFNSFTASLK
jgi:hypothetical protein